MSRIGRQPIPVPAGVTVAIEPESVRVNGPKGELMERIHRDIEVTQDGERLLVSRPTDRGEHRALHGLTRSLVANMVQGVTSGFEETLELVGVGYRAAMKGQALSMQLGFSHDVDIPPPEGIAFAVPKQTEIRISGIDKQLVGEVTARIRRIRPPEPYKGKGVRYAGEKVRRKEGKKK
jgi:large subunit ribosomal protein L6